MFDETELIKLVACVDKNNVLNKKKGKNKMTQNQWTEEYGMELANTYKEQMRTAQNEEEYMSAIIQYLQQKDINEYKADKANKSYFLSRFIKNEIVVRSAKAGCTKINFKLNVQATKALIGLGFLIEDGSIAFSIKPLDRKTYMVTAKLYSENLTNAQIFYYNSEYELNIPLNENKEVIPDEEQYENNFTASNILQLMK